MTVDPRVPPARASYFSRLSLFIPGMLVAATGVGAGDLLTASLAGSRFGLTLLWAAWVGALLKWYLNEGIARWQLATGTTLLEGWVTRLGAWVRWVFGAYLVAWPYSRAARSPAPAASPARDCSRSATSGPRRSCGACCTRWSAWSSCGGVASARSSGSWPSAPD
jgi:hypothetical protein